MQGSLQERLQQAAMRLAGSQASHARTGNLGQRLDQAALGEAAGSRDLEMQRRIMGLPSRPSSMKKTPLPESAQRAPALDMHAVSKPSQCLFVKM